MPASIQELIAWILLVGAARFSIWIMKQVKRPDWDKDTKTYVGMTVAAIIGVIVWLFDVVVMQYTQMPTGDWRAWVNAGGAVALAVGLGSKVWYDQWLNDGTR